MNDSPGSTQNAQARVIVTEEETSNKAKLLRKRVMGQ
jgi:hypothetical protein